MWNNPPLRVQTRRLIPPDGLGGGVSNRFMPRYAGVFPFSAGRESDGLKEPPGRSGSFSAPKLAPGLRAEAEKEVQARSMAFGPEPCQKNPIEHWIGPLSFQECFVFVWSHNFDSSTLLRSFVNP